MISPIPAGIDSIYNNLLHLNPLKKVNWNFDFWSMKISMSKEPDNQVVQRKYSGSLGRISPRNKETSYSMYTSKKHRIKA
jgi:hypothetical protein